MRKISFDINTHAGNEMLNITETVQKAVSDSGIKEGICTVFVPHTTAAVTINEKADPDVVHDILNELDKIVPWEDGYRHFEGNSAAHIKSSMFGTSLQIIIGDGHLQLGTWQAVYFCEFDGPRKRQFFVKISD